MDGKRRGAGRQSAHQPAGRIQASVAGESHGRLTCIGVQPVVSESTTERRKPCRFMTPAVTVSSRARPLWESNAWMLVESMMGARGGVGGGTVPAAALQQPALERGGPRSAGQWASHLRTHNQPAKEGLTKN